MDSSHLALATLAIDQQNGHRALTHLDAIEDLSSVTPWVLRSQANHLLDEPQRALEAAKRGLHIDPSDDDLLLALSQAHNSLGNKAEAEQAILAVLNSNPEHQQGLFFYATLLVTSGDPEGAIGIFDRLEPGYQLNESGFVLRAMIANAQGNEVEAQRLIEHALEINPEFAPAHGISFVTAAAQANPSGYSAGETAARLDPDKMAELGRWSNYMRHPLMFPNRVVQRIGPIPLWIGTMSFFFLGPRIAPGLPYGWLIIVHVSLVAYTWVAPHLFVKWLERSGKL